MTWGDLPLVSPFLRRLNPCPAPHRSAGDRAILVYPEAVDSPNPDITRLLANLDASDPSVVDSVLPVVYAELKALARSKLRGERSDHTLNPTALVHEAYVKLAGQARTDWKNRAHFFGVAAQAMRRILIDHAKARQAQKRGSGEAMATFDEGAVVQASRADDLVALDHALSELADRSARECRAVELSVFVGLTHEEIAEVLGVSVPTVRRDLRLARAWLTRHLQNDEG